tara:strand:- start:367 stop:525 length:159 start_codon:yes stop_codon:yes gene_type:complete
MLVSVSKAIALNDKRVDAVADAVYEKFDIDNKTLLKSVVKLALVDLMFEDIS